MEDFEYLRYLGSGAEAQVHLVRGKNPKGPRGLFALKVISKVASPHISHPRSRGSNHSGYPVVIGRLCGQDFLKSCPEHKVRKRPPRVEAHPVLFRPSRMLRASMLRQPLRAADAAPAARERAVGKCRKSPTPRLQWLRAVRMRRCTYGRSEIDCCACGATTQISAAPSRRVGAGTEVEPTGHVLVWLVPIAAVPDFRHSVRAAPPPSALQCRAGTQPSPMRVSISGRGKQGSEIDSGIRRYCSGGELLEMLKAHGHTCIPEEWARFYGAEVICSQAFVRLRR